MALMCFDSVIDEQSLLEAPNAQIICIKCMSECCQERLNDEQMLHVWKIS